MGRWQSHRSQEGEMPSFPSGATSWVWGPVLGSQHQTDVGILERVQQRWMWCLWPCLNALCKSWSLWGRNKEPRKTFINSISFWEGSVWASPDKPKIKLLLWGWWNWNNARGCQDRLHSLYPWAYSKPTARVPGTLLWAERLGPDLQRSQHQLLCDPLIPSWQSHHASTGRSYEQSSFCSSQFTLHSCELL